MTRPLHLMIIAGEVSGDMHAAALVRELRKSVPDLVAFGIGGPALRAENVETMYDVDQMAVLGLVEVLKRLPFFRGVFYRMLDEEARRRPDAVVLVDYPGFNLRFAAALRNRASRAKRVYYICPQVWAWHTSRIPRMAAMLDLLITLFPFEKDVFAGTGLKVEFAGHPLVDAAARAHAAPREELPWPGQPRLALLPGSRAQEVQRILPAMWRAAGLVERERPGTGAVVATPSAQITGVVRDVVAGIRDGPSRWEIVEDRTREVLRQADAGMVASGTATVEAAIMGCPMLVVYRVAPLTYHLLKHMVKIPNIGMVNIIAGRTVCPEFIQAQASPARLADAVLPLLDHAPRRAKMVAELVRVRELLGAGNSSARAAGFILRELAQPAALPPHAPCP